MSVASSSTPDRESAERVTSGSSSRPRWLLLYFALAAFNLITVLGSLYLNHRLGVIYSTAVTQNQRWAERLGDLSALRVAASAVNAPGNDVFDTRDADRESRTLRQARAVFEIRRQAILSDYLSLPPAERSRVIDPLTEAGTAMQTMVTEAEATLDAFRGGDSERAAQRMATMDETYSTLTGALARTEQLVRDLQAVHLDSEAALARTLWIVEIVVAAFVVLMICGVLVYGQIMAREVRVAAAEREGFVKQLQASEARTRELIATAREGFFTFDESGRIQSANPSLGHLVGQSADRLVGEPISSIVPALMGLDHTQLREALTADSHVQTVARVWTVVSASGAQHDVELSVSEISAESGRLYSAVVHDVTARTHTTAALEQARKAAEDASFAKSAFLANMSHELRTPLNAIIGYGEMLHEVAQERGDSESAADLERIHTAGKHLLGLINDILDLSKIEAGKTTLHIEEVNATSLLSEVEMTAASLAKKCGNRLLFEVGPSVGSISVDVVKFRQILLNLIGNACKFTTNGTVTVAAEVFASSAGPQFRVSVTDSGIGMSHEQLGRLFKPFSQADESTTRKYGGTGLGLVLSQRFTQLLGGQISVSSRQGIGSQFVVTLPLRQTAGTIEVSERQVTPVRPLLEPSYVLIVDDDPLTQELIGRQLSRMGVSWRAALNASDALRMAREQIPMAITLDLLLPDQHGLTVLATLKADPQLAFVPVVVVSMLDDRSAGYALGASEYLVKPIDGVKLVSMLSRLLPASGSRRILVVDDDSDARVVVARRAAEFGASVMQASNGEEALASARAQRPDLVLLDLMMPVMDGFGVMDAMRDDPTLRDVPIVVVTAQDMAEDDLARLTGSVTALVHKQPYDQNAVMDEIGRLVASHAKQTGAFGASNGAAPSITLH